MQKKREGAQRGQELKPKGRVGLEEEQGYLFLPFQSRKVSICGQRSK